MFLTYRRLAGTTSLVLALCLADLNMARAQFADISARVPDSANAILLIDIDRLMESPVGKRERWRMEHQRLFDAGLVMVPTQATQVLAATELDLETMSPEWQLALMNLEQEIPMSEVALKLNGSVDRIGDRDVAVLPGDTYAVRFGPRMTAIGAPAERQDVARWLRRIDSNSLRGLSPYLEEGRQFVQSTAHIIMALDLEDAVSPAAVQLALLESQTLANEDFDLDALSQALSSIRGVSLGVTVTDRRNGAIKVDFHEDITAIQDFAKPLLLEILGNNGVMINEFEDWEVSVNGTEIRMNGILEKSGMQRLLSFLSVPPVLQRARADADEKQTDEQRVILASQQYFNAVTSLLDDLHKDKRNRTTMGQIGVFFANYARRIDQLPILNVDEQLVAFGRMASQSLRQGQMSIQEAGARSRIGQQNVPTQYDVRTYSNPIGVTWFGSYGWQGWSATPNVRATEQARARVRTQENIRGSMSANLVLQHLDNAAADLRVAMTQKYNTAF